MSRAEGSSRPRSAAIVPLVLCLALLFAHGAWLVATAQAAFAYREHARDFRSPRSGQALHLAATLTPWSAPRLAALATLRAQDSNAEAIATFRRAVRWAPGDPYVWQKMAAVLAATGRLDTNLEFAVARAAALAPTSPAIRARLARNAVRLWLWSSPALRAHWLETLRYQLRRAPSALRRDVVHSGRLAHYCHGPAPALGDQTWCASALATAATCARPDLKPGHHRWCERAGLRS
jgi:hypothetical protein